MTSDDPSSGPVCGVVYAATGKRIYSDLAARSAASFKRYNPGVEVDLYTDQDHGGLDVFDRIHILENPWARSKIDAMRLSRFDRTLMLDCDTMVVADVMPAFEVLDRFDMAMAYDYRPNGTLNYEVWRTRVPVAMPQFNSGVIAVRRSEATDRFFVNWARAVRDHDMGRDQPTFRELVYESDLRIVTLPEVFNLLKVDNMKTWDQFSLAPRIVHSPLFHANFERYSKVADPVEERLGLRLSWRRRLLHGSDRSLAEVENRPHIPWKNRDLRRGWVWILPQLPKRIYAALGRKIARRIRK